MNGDSNDLKYLFVFVFVIHLRGAVEPLTSCQDIPRPGSCNCQPRMEKMEEVEDDLELVVDKDKDEEEDEEYGMGEDEVHNFAS